MKLKRGSTSVRRLIFIADSSSTTGAGLANLAFNTASLVGYYFAGDLANEVQITLATATLGTFASGGFIAVDNTNMPGWYEIGIPDAALDGGNECAIQLRGAANMVPVNVYIEIDAFDYQTATQPVNATQFAGQTITAAAGVTIPSSLASPTNITAGTITTVTTLTNLPSIPAGWLTAAGIAADAITAAKIADGAIDTATFASGTTLPRVTLVDTCTTNTDMRGTDSAALAATALSTAVWTNGLATNLGTTNTTVATNLNTTVSSRSSQTSVDTIDDLLDTEMPALTAAVAAEAVKTSNIQTRLPAALESGRIAAALDSAGINAIADQVWDEATSGHTTSGTYGGRIVRATNSNVEVQITGSYHIAADVHEFQSGVITAGDFAANSLTASALATDAVAEIQSGLATSAALAAAKTILDKVDTGLVVDGAVYQFTANMLELGPAGGGGGGSGDATLAKQEEILTQLDVIQTKTDTIGSVGAITSLLAAAVLEPGTITSFPETLTIGDSYTEQNGREIQIPIVDTDGTPLSSTGSLNFADASVTFTLQRSGETDSTRVITGTATFVDPPGTGTGAGAPYAVIELPASETAKGLKKYKYSGILTFLWTGTGTDQLSFTTGTVTFTYGN